MEIIIFHNLHPLHYRPITQAQKYTLSECILLRGNSSSCIFQFTEFHILLSLPLSLFLSCVGNWIQISHENEQWKREQNLAELGQMAALMATWQVLASALLPHFFLPYESTPLETTTTQLLKSDMHFDRTSGTAYANVPNDDDVNSTFPLLAFVDSHLSPLWANNLITHS